MSRNWLRSGLGLGLIGLLGCTLGNWDPNYLIPMKRRVRVEAAAEAYGLGLRWGDFERSLALVHPSARAAFRDVFRDAGQAPHFTEFELEGVVLGEDRERASVHVSFSLYRPPGIRESRISEVQAWVYDPSARSWFLESPDLALYIGDVGAY